MVRRRWLQALGLASVFVLLLNIGGRAAHWSISAVHVEGAKFIEASQVAAMVREQIQQRRWLVLPQRVKSFFDTTALRRTLEQQFPFARWSVDKDGSGAVLVTIQERQAQLVWVADGKTYYVDAQGLLFSDVRAAESSADTAGVIRHDALLENLPVVLDESKTAASLGTAAVTPATVAFIRSLAAALSDGTIALPAAVVSYRYDPATYRLALETVLGYDIYFAVNQPLSDQMEKLKVALQQGIARRTNLHYIDVRFGQKIFYQ